MVQDFTGNRESLRQAVKKWDPKISLLTLVQSQELMDPIDRAMYDDHPAIRRQITSQAIAKITQHLSGMPGRKSLVWVSDTPGWAGSQFLGQANIHLYPVLARGVGSSGVVAWLRDKRELGLGTFASTSLPMASGNEIENQHANAALAAANGASGFTDSRDISAAVRTAQEDAANVYILGFYPREEALDNKFHMLTVDVNKKGAAHGRTLEVRYRPGYLATRLAPPVAARSSLEDVLRNPLDASAIGITAVPGSADGKYQVAVTVDLRDIHFEMQDNHHVAAVALSFADDASGQIQTRNVKLSFTDAEFATALQRGLNFSEILEQKAAVRIVVQDASTGLAGSLRVVPPEDSAGDK